MEWAILSFIFSMVALGNSGTESYVPWFFTSLMSLMAAFEAKSAEDAIDVVQKSQALTDRLINEHIIENEFICKRCGIRQNSSVEEDHY